LTAYQGAEKSSWSGDVALALRYRTGVETSRAYILRREPGAKVKMWKKFLIVNVGAILGCFVALFLVPGTTRLTVFLFIAGGTILLANTVFVAVPMFRKEIPKNAARTERARLKPIVIWTLMLTVLLIDLILRYIHYFP